MKTNNKKPKPLEDTVLDPDKLDRTTLATVQDLLYREARTYVAALWWSTDRLDANSVLQNGSCFFLDIGGSRFGVTAAHVITKFFEHRDQHAKLYLRINNLDIAGLDERIIARDDGLDLCTFKIMDDELDKIGVRPHQCVLAKWPPPPPDKGKGVFFAGYPGGPNRKVINKKSIEFEQTVCGLVVHDYDGHEIEIHVDPANLRPYKGEAKPTTADLGGCSGAPLLALSAKAAGPLFWVCGVMIRQFPVKTEDQTTILWARRPDFIMPDGSLKGGRPAS